MKNYLQIVRFPNLLIVALTQILLQYAFIVPSLSRLGIVPALTTLEFILFVLITVLIAASGYVVNDIEDIATDRINKPLEKQLVGRVFSVQEAWKIYNVLVLTILILVAFFTTSFGHITFFIPFYLFSVATMWVYSKWLKKLPFSGNIFVALYCALTAIVVLYTQNMYEPSVIEMQKGYFGFSLRMLVVALGYGAFAFFSTLFREIVKDIEDVEGDAHAHCKTLPIVLGIKKTKIIALLVGVQFLLAVFYFSYLISDTFLAGTLILNLFVSLPMFYIMFLLWNAREKADYSRVSGYAKLIMLSGIVFILVMANGDF
jgi:4-hydroxybenzoate polyprenyltransferase